MARSSPPQAPLPDLAAACASLTPPRHRHRAPQGAELELASSPSQSRLPWTSPGGSIYLSTAAAAAGARARAAPPGRTVARGLRPSTSAPALSTPGRTAAPMPPGGAPEPGPAAPAPSPAREAASSLSLHPSRSAPTLGTERQLASRPPPPPRPASAETGTLASGRWFWLELPVP